MALPSVLPIERLNWANERHDAHFRQAARAFCAARLSVPTRQPAPMPMTTMARIKTLYGVFGPASRQQAEAERCDCEAGDAETPCSGRSGRWPARRRRWSISIASDHGRQQPAADRRAGAQHALDEERDEQRRAERRHLMQQRAERGQGDDVVAKQA